MLTRFRVFLLLCALCTLSRSLDAALVSNFDFRTGGTPGVQLVDDSIWEFTMSGLSDNGVTFDAIVRVDGASFLDSTINRTSKGLDTGVLNGMQWGDSLALSIAFENVSGGAVSGTFISAALNNDGGGQQTANFSDGGTFLSYGLAQNEIVNLAFADSHSIFSVSGTNLTTPGFFLQGVGIQFIATPEPASLAMMSMVAITLTGMGYRSRRRKSHKNALAT